MFTPDATTGVVARLDLAAVDVLNIILKMAAAMQPLATSTVASCSYF